eukprot:CAMPEP_0115529954 /NCGR_PEP_ID=MMETSP0271-20121206/84233_1 /TAXON_ID=71861 /ORGANISM="Scrippsiella trochoidea, Strain CCMP3099" /LENGTH=423 /DNA_ID=CAMNT_0002962043 /DNA_START=272 /DNA_END=1545 /DNA_ORIENTATION=+
MALRQNDGLLGTLGCRADIKRFARGKAAEPEGMKAKQVAGSALKGRFVSRIGRMKDDDFRMHCQRRSGATAAGGLGRFRPATGGCGGAAAAGGAAGTAACLRGATGAWAVGAERCDGGVGAGGVGAGGAASSTASSSSYSSAPAASPPPSVSSSGTGASGKCSSMSSSSKGFTSSPPQAPALPPPSPPRGSSTATAAAAAVAAAGTGAAPWEVSSLEGTTSAVQQLAQPSPPLPPPAAVAAAASAAAAAAASAGTGNWAASMAGRRASAPPLGEALLASACSSCASALRFPSADSPLPPPPLTGFWAAAAPLALQTPRAGSAEVAVRRSSTSSMLTPLLLPALTPASTVFAAADLLSHSGLSASCSAPELPAAVVTTNFAPPLPKEGSMSEDLFRQIDVKKDGVIDISEFRNALKSNLICTGA